MVAQSDGVSTEYFVNDGLGSVRQLVDPVGEVLLAQTYDPYGSLYASAGVDSTAFGYAGEQEDINGLVFLRARYYSPSMGRFLNTDPSRQETNPYQYGLGNPVKFTDPGGLYTSDVYPVRPPSQYSYGPDYVPTWYEGNLAHKLEFEPGINLNPLLTDPPDPSKPNSQFELETDYTTEEEFNNFCGTVDVGMLAQNLLEDSPSVSEILDALIIGYGDKPLEDKDGIISKEEAKSVVGFDVLIKLANALGLSPDGDAISGYETDYNVYDSKIRSRLSATQLGMSQTLCKSLVSS